MAPQSCAVRRNSKLPDSIGQPSTILNNPMAIMKIEKPQLDTNGYRILPGWRVGHLVEESSTRSGLLVPAGTESTNDALSLVDIASGRRFWAVPTGAWRFLWPATGRVAVAVRESQIIAEEDDGTPTDENSYL